MRTKEGTRREDGMVFWTYSRGKEVWINEEIYRERHKRRQQYHQKCRELAQEMRLRKDPMDRPFLGKYDFARNLYFIEHGSNGKEIWGSKYKLELYKARHKRCNDLYRLKCAALPDTGLLVGDPHPIDKSLFVIRKVGNKIFWGIAEELAKVRESRRIIQEKSYQRQKRKMQQFYSQLGKHRRKKGEKNENGLIFWRYLTSAKEQWLTNEEYERRRDLERKRKRKKHRASPNAS